ncbi:SOS response-associated peptidase family protein [Massilia antarctica]|uniref:Abasic site processing protein n=1 Tax=Massilia antarctica TaxID=2765360 RepID=A0AA49A7P9_9BURK|nr:SOS response-associated peptidase family protein [Massilia antarctica]QPI49336.1 SOS response-associated peptidase family protein [Massilia antarctica]
MCGRLDQNHTAIDYVAAMHWRGGAPRVASQAAPSYNAPPGTWRPLMRIVDGQLVLADAFWGYRASWAADKLPISINARLEKLGNRYWMPLLKAGRAIVPADGWYEWTGEKGRKQPWHIHLKTREPLFIAAIGACASARAQAAESGFAIVTADAEGGMVDVHDRRPIVFSAEDAALWLDPDLSAQQAEQLARSVALGPDAFEWHPVPKEVGRAGNDGPHLAAQLDLLA